MRNYTVLTLVAAALLAAACSKTSAVSEGEGSLSLGIELCDATKASMSSEDLLATSRVNIYYADFSGLVRTYQYSEAPGTIFLPAGEYRADVIAGEAAKAAPSAASWDQKSYKGSSAFNIIAGSSTAVNVVAKVNNAISKVSFGDGVAANFASGYSLKIAAGDGELIYDASKSGSEGYFIVSGIDEPSFEWTFDGTLLNGEPFTKSGKVEGIEAGKLYAMSLQYTVKDGIAAFDLYVDYSTDIIDDTIVFEAVSTGIALSAYYEIWAKHATVHADVDESEYTDPAKLSFAYSADGINWTSVPAVRDSEGAYSAVFSGLTPETQYTYKLLYDGEEICESAGFLTEAAPAIPNGGFEQTSKSKSGNYYEFYASGDTPWWGSGNGSSGINGSADFGGFIICKPDTGETASASSTQSACLVSQWALVKFAAGNLFTGYFAGLVGTKGGKVAFGRNFTGRPTALKVSVKYSTGKINRIDGSPAGVSITKDMYDVGRVQIALGTWDSAKYGGDVDPITGIGCPILVDTTDPSTFVDYATDKSTVAFGDLQLVGDSSNSHNEWKTYTINLDYRDIQTMPKFIVISCASSKYGDYFTGCDSSTMWIDDMELIYE